MEDSNTKVQSELLQYLKDEIENAPLSLFKGITYLNSIDLSGCQIKELKGNLFNGLKTLYNVNFSNNQIEKLPGDLFNGLIRLDLINFSNNRLKSIPENLFKGVETLIRVNFSYNQIQDVPVKLFQGLTYLDRINFSHNRIKCLPANLFNGLEQSCFNEGLNTIDSIMGINFSNNHLTKLPDYLFHCIKSLQSVNFSNNHIKAIPDNLFLGIEILWDLNFSYNQIKTIPNKFFKSIEESKGIDFSNNQIAYIPEELFNDIRLLKDINFSSNYISSLSLSILDNISLYVDLRNNFSHSDTDLIFNSLFLITSSRLDPAEKFLRKKDDPTKLNESLLVLYLDKRCSKINDFASDFSLKLSKLDTAWSILDFLINIMDLNDFTLISLHSKISSMLKENKFLKNEEFKMFSADSVQVLCERDNLELFKIFLPVKNIDDEENPSELNKYLTGEEFYLQVNFCKCMDIAIFNRNEKIAIYLMRILNHIFENRTRNERSKINLNELKYVNIKEFRQKLFNEYFPAFFNELAWYNAVEFILNMSTPNRYIDFLKSDRLVISIKNNQVVPESMIYMLSKSRKPKSEGKESENKDKVTKDNNLLVLIRNSNRESLLRHETTKELLNIKWESLPIYFYIINLISYLTFIIFYSINIELYKSSSLNANVGYLLRSSVFICVGFVGLFIFFELLHIIDSFISRRLLAYFMSFRNLADLVNYPLVLITIYLGFSEVKSVLFSITILLSYIGLITRLNMFYGIGPYVTVFGNVVRKSLRLLVILIICMIGFLLSLRNRGNYDFGTNPNVSNSIEYFNTTFELSLFRMFSMTVGQISTDGMGIDYLTGNNFINFFIYGLFIFIMPIMFINIFTGISIDEIQTLINRSEAQNISERIDYVFKFETLKSFKGNFLIFILVFCFFFL